MLTKTIYRVLSFVIGCAVLFSLPVIGVAVGQQGEPTLLVYGQTVSGEINSTQPSLMYSFDAEIGDVVTVTMIVTGGGIDPFLVLSDMNNNPLATDDNSGGGLNARLTFVIPAAGRYLIQATHAGGIVPEDGGTFGLNLTAAVGGQLPPTPQPSEVSPPVQENRTRLVALQPGAAVQDVLDRQVAFRLYWFEGQSGEQVAVTPEQMADFQPLIVLYDANFTELQRSTPGISLNAALTSDGLFFLVVSLPDSGSAGGGYSFVFNLNALSPAASGNYPEISYGQSQRGNIDGATPVVTYRFRGSAGDTVTIAMKRAGGDLNSYLYLLDASSQLLYEDNDSGGENGDARITYTLPASGDYLILATRMGREQGITSGSYLLELISNSPAPSITPTVEPTLPSDYQNLPQMTYGQTVEGELSDARVMDVYVFRGTAGDPITIEMNSLNQQDPNGLDPYLILLDDARIPLIENDDIVQGEVRDSHIDFTLSRTGYYAIVATRYDQENGTSTGPYRLTLTGPGGEVEPTGTIPEAVLIEKLSSLSLLPGAPAQGTFDTVAHLFSFTAQAGALVDLSVTTDPGLDSVLILADQNLNEVTSSGTGALTGLTIPQTGRYLVILAPRFGPVNAAGGGYILALTQAGGTVMPEAANGIQPLAYGQTATRAIDSDTISQLYTFAGLAGERVRITMEATPGSSLDCYLELQDANGTVLEANDDIDPGINRNSRIAATLPADGDYLILASRYVDANTEPTAGTYRLSLERLAEESQPGVSAETIPITYDQTLVGEINDEQYLLFYVFDGTAGDVITITVNHLSNENLDTMLYLYQSSPSGWIEIANNDDSPLGGTYDPLLSGIVLPQTGKYLIAIGRYDLQNNTASGTFAITVTRGS
jgi:hypothetical protein